MGFSFNQSSDFDRGPGWGMCLNKVSLGFHDHLSDYLSHMSNLPIPHQVSKESEIQRLMVRLKIPITGSYHFELGIPIVTSSSM